MRVRSKMFLTAALLTTSIALATAGGALADAGSGDTSSKPPVDTSSSKPPVDTSSKPPVDTSSKPPVDTSSSKPPVDTKAPPVTEVPTAPPVTEVPKPTPPAAVVPVTAPVTTPVVESPVGETPTEPEIANEPGCIGNNLVTTGSNCIPDTPGIERSSTPGSGAELPFTGPGDVILAIVIALIAGTGGILFMFGAAGREQLDVLNKRGMDSPSGFQLAYRELRKEQVER